MRSANNLCLQTHTFKPTYICFYSEFRDYAAALDELDYTDTKRKTEYFICNDFIHIYHDCVWPQIGV